MGLLLLLLLLEIKMSRVPNTKLSDQWEKKVEHVSNLIFQNLDTLKKHYDKYKILFYFLSSTNGKNQYLPI
jgi:hypothetical protein